MDAMILAAGLGTRLGDITQDTPKALVDVAGATPLDRIARRLVDAGADRLIINVHHHADRIMEHVRSRGGYGVDVLFSPERDAPLETGGGLLHAAPLFRLTAPFFLHNVDVLTTADLPALYAAHVASGALATLAVNQRRTSRYLLFDNGALCGRLRLSPGETAPPADGDGRRCFAFAGVHVISPELLGRVAERGAFSIIDAYLRLATAGERIACHDISDAEWLEIGTPERLEAARRALG
jgi:N-acetyl-alpha-D-muramate 1-phosphate uridylyltransferase